jgi:hypothetical protein
MRRSIRLEGKNKRFKCDVSSQGNDCFCCAVEPPNLLGKAIRSLGKEFWKISIDKLTEERLQKKPPPKKATQIGHPNKKENKPNEDKSSKKFRKE